MAGRPSFHNAAWRRACNGGSCVEVAHVDGWVGMRDSKLGDESPVLVFTAEEWRAFVKGVRDGRLDVL